MSHFAIDDKWHSHPKTVQQSLGARGLWSTCGSWAKDYRTGGFVPAATIKAFGGTKKQVQELVDAGTWFAVEGGYQFHDWEQYQLQGKVALTPAEKQAAYRQRKRDAELASVAERYQDGNAPSNEEGNGSVDIPSRARAVGVGVGVGNVTPSSTEHRDDPRAGGVTGTDVAVAMVEHGNGRWLGSYSTDPLSFDAVAAQCRQHGGDPNLLCQAFWATVKYDKPGPAQLRKMAGALLAAQKGGGATPLSVEQLRELVEDLEARHRVAPENVKVADLLTAKRAELERLTGGQQCA